MAFLGMSGSGGGSSRGSSTNSSRGFNLSTFLSQLISNLFSSGQSTGTTTGTTGGTSTGTSSTTSPYAGILANIGQGLSGTGTAITKQVGNQMLEALRTGGVNSFIPWITRNLDTVRSSGSQGVQNLRQTLSRAGFGNTAAGQAQIAQANQAANQATANVPSEAAQSLISQAPGFGLNAANAGVGAISAAQPFSATTTTANQFNTNSIQNSIQNFIQQQIQNVINNAISQGGFSQVNTGTTNQSSQPGFWDLFSQGLQDAALAYGG